jgi:hypothetical protein
LRLRQGVWCLRVLAAGMMAGVSAVAPDDDLAVLAEIQGVLIEVLETRNAELAAQVTELAERLERAGCAPGLEREPG